MRYHGLVTLAITGWSGILPAQEMFFPRVLSSPGTRTQEQRAAEPSGTEYRTAPQHAAAMPASDRVPNPSSNQTRSFPTRNTGSARPEFGDSLGAPSFARPPSLLRSDAAQATPAVSSNDDSPGSFEEEMSRLREELKSFEDARDEVTRIRKSIDTETEQSSSTQRQELIDLLTKFATKRAAARAVAPPPSPTKTPPPVAPNESFVPPPELPFANESVAAPPFESDIAPSSSIPDDVADPFALGKVLMKSGDYVSAEQAFRKVKAPDENFMMAQYLMATAIRKQSHWKRATDAYRVIADSKQDPVLRNLAQWQIENIRWQQQTELQLDQIRKQREQGTASLKRGRPEEKSSRK